MAYHPIGGRLIPEKLVQLDNLLSTIPGCECRVAPNETLYIINLTDVYKRQASGREPSATAAFSAPVSSSRAVSSAALRGL